MATGFAIAGFALAAGSTYMGYKSGKAGAKAQREAAEQQARFDRIERAETIKRERTRFRQDKGMMVARSSASGFAVDAASHSLIQYAWQDKVGEEGRSSLDRYIDSQTQQHIDDINWIRTSGASMDAVRAREANARYSIARSNIAGQAIGGIGNSIGQLGNVATTYQEYGWGFTPKAPPPA